MNPVEPAVEEYLYRLIEPRLPPTVLEMQKAAKKNGFPIIGPLAGQVLMWVAQSAAGKSCFEFGSGYGYSAYWFLTGLGSDGRITCVDGDAANKTEAERYLTELSLWDRVDFHTGKAQDVFQSQKKTFEIIYNDADKDQYPEIWHLARTHLPPGGIYIADNTIWRGRVTEKGLPDNDRYPGWTKAVAEHNQMIAQDPDFDWFINPIRDGVLFARRRS